MDPRLESSRLVLASWLQGHNGCHSEGNIHRWRPEVSTAFVSYAEIIDCLIGHLSSNSRVSFRKHFLHFLQAKAYHLILTSKDNRDSLDMYHFERLQ